MSVTAVLAATADRIERWPDYKIRHELRPGAGGAVYTELFEVAKQMYGWAAVEHLQKHLGGHGQLQHWRETDQQRVVKTLREAAGQPAADDAEAAAARAKLDEFHAALAEAMGWLGYDVTTLVREVGSEMGRLRRENERLQRELAEEQRRTRGLHASGERADR